MILLRKAKEWAYEKEWRIIDEQGKQASPLCLKEVIFGEKSRDKFCYLVMQVLRAHKAVEFHKMYRDHTSYKLSLREIDPESDGRTLSPPEPLGSDEQQRRTFLNALKEAKQKEC